MHGDGYFDERVAASDAEMVDPVVDLLVELASGCTLGIWTGRIALPLAQRGVPVSVWPPELDLMAELAGTRLGERWSG